VISWISSYFWTDLKIIIVPESSLWFICQRLITIPFVLGSWSYWCDKTVWYFLKNTVAISFLKFMNSCTPFVFLFDNYFLLHRNLFPSQALINYFLLLKLFILGFCWRLLTKVRSCFAADSVMIDWRLMRLTAVSLFIKLLLFHFESYYNLKILNLNFLWKTQIQIRIMTWLIFHRNKAEIKKRLIKSCLVNWITIAMMSKTNSQWIDK
jgi:hypothetical protein